MTVFIESFKRVIKKNIKKEHYHHNAHHFHNGTRGRTRTDMA